MCECSSQVIGLEVLAKIAGFAKIVNITFLFTSLLTTKTLFFLMHIWTRSNRQNLPVFFDKFIQVSIRLELNQIKIDCYTSFWHWWNRIYCSFADFWDFCWANSSATKLLGVNQDLIYETNLAPESVNYRNCIDFIKVRLKNGIT